ncbi:MAG: hypothetical protein V1792_29105 [Pseudomonadota bacterium]
MRSNVRRTGVIGGRTKDYAMVCFWFIAYKEVLLCAANAGNIDGAGELFCPERAHHA